MIAKMQWVLIVPVVLCGGCAQPATLIARDKLCESWRHQTVGNDDVLTDKTASGIEGNNNARTEWGCQFGRNRVKS